MKNTRILNEEQLQAVRHEQGPLLIIAGAGTGKTTVITERIKHLILDEGVKPSEILALTFTEKAAREMEERVDVALPYGYTQMWISTFHAFCDRILRDEASHIGLDPGYHLMTEAQSILFLRRHLAALNLSYFRPLGNPYKFLQGMLTHFSRLKDDDISPLAYQKYAQELEKKQDVPKDEIEKTLELARAYKTYEELKARESVMDFGDLIANVLKLFRTRQNVLSYYQKKFKYILVDEFQDTNFAQNELAILLSGDRNNMNVVGDDDQCLPGGTEIQTQNGLKKIRDVKKGDMILTAIGKGNLGVSKVNKVFSSKKKTMFITVKTESGRTLSATYNHKMFCYVPKKVERKTIYYVYLMYRRNLGWRIGITNDLVVRLKLDRLSDTIIGLRSFHTEEEARYYELLWSLTYQMPTCIFRERARVIMQGQWVKKLYNEIDTEQNAKKLAQDLYIDIKSYHYMLDTAVRGNSKRIKISFYQCYRNYATKKNYRHKIQQKPLISHLVHLETSDSDIIRLLEQHGVRLEKAKKGMRVRYSSNKIEQAQQFADYLARLTGGFIEFKSTVGVLNEVHLPAHIMPAGNLQEGHFLPIVKNNRVHYEKITSVTREFKTQTVYDLEVDQTHNFIAQGIIVHNSIYRWRGAAIANIIQFREHFPKAKIITLTKNYRSTHEILDRAYALIQNNNPDRLEVKEHVNKKLVSMRDVTGEAAEFLFGKRVEDEADLVAEKIKWLVAKKKIQYKDIAILVRANDHAQPFTRALERSQIPFQFLGPGHLFHQEEIKDLIAYLKVLYNFEDNASMYRVLSLPMYKISAREIAVMLNSARRKNMSLFEVLEEIDDVKVKDETREAAKKIVAMIRRHMERIAKDTAGQILYYFVENTGMLQKYLETKNALEERRMQNIAKFFEKLKTYEAEQPDASVFAVVDWIDLSMQLGESPVAADIDWSENNAVNILTIHSSKGLEFPAVFLVNLVAQRFPTRNRKDQIPVPEDLIREELPEGDYNLQEERRLFYVGATRARDYLGVTAAHYYGEGKRERKLSPFVYETFGKTEIEKVLARREAETKSEQLSLLSFAPPPVPIKENAEKMYMRLPVTYLSYSQIQTFDVCPLHYKLRYLLNMPGEPTSALSYGSSVHNVLRDYYQQIILGEKPSTGLTDELLAKYWMDEGYKSKHLEREAYSQAKSLLAKYVKEDLAREPQILAVETSFTFGIKGLKFGGRIDRIDRLPDGKLEIIDYKTGSNAPDAKELKSNKQMTFYGLAAREVHDGVLGKSPEDILLTLEYIETGQRLTTTRTNEQLDEAKQYVLDKAKEINESDFRCSGGMLCQTCEYSMLCQTIGE